MLVNIIMIVSFIFFFFFVFGELIIVDFSVLIDICFIFGYSANFYDFVTENFPLKFVQMCKNREISML